jgi:hypothetical protein
MMEDTGFDFEPEEGTVNKDAGFVSLYRMELGRVIWMVTVGALHPKDLTVLFTYLRFLEWRTGRVRCSLDKLAEILERKKSTLYSSIKRLKENKVIVPTIDKMTGERVLIINPRLVRASGGRSRGYAIKNYNDAVEYNESDRQEIDDLDL